MRRFLIVLTLTCLVAVAAACGSGSSDSTSVAKDDVAVVGDTTITVDQLNRQIELAKKTAQVNGQKVPEVGTKDYHDTLVAPIVDRLVLNAQIENIASQLGVKVTDDDIQKALDDAIKQSFNGSQEKYQEYIKKYGLTDDEVREFLVRPSVVQKKVQDKLTSDQKITDADVQKYYDENKDKPPISTPDTRDVQFILTGSRADALAAEKALSDGEDWDKVAKRYAIPPGPPSTGGDFTATKGQLETNFGNAVFGDLATGDVSGLIPVSEAYESSNLSGKCKPDCFFIVKPKSDVKPGGQQSFDDAKAQIRQQLETQVLDKARAKFNALLTAQKKLTHYNPAYKPAATTAASGGAAPTT
ncbi:MAG TPA: SurA N-terminal domain-containing protein [Gaiellales bacterium]|nr:SurA N-terminal domain-containing protein [Gaiellales bacterium]